MNIGKNRLAARDILSLICEEKSFELYRSKRVAVTI